MCSAKIRIQVNLLNVAEGNGDVWYTYIPKEHAYSIRDTLDSLTLLPATVEIWVMSCLINAEVGKTNSLFMYQDENENQIVHSFWYVLNYTCDEPTNTSM